MASGPKDSPVAQGPYRPPEDFGATVCAETPEASDRLSREKIPEPGTKDRVCIVGFGESRKLAPYDDPTVEVWGINHGFPYTKRWDVWYEYHSPQELEAGLKPSIWRDMAAFLTSGGIDVKPDAQAYAGPQRPIYVHDEETVKRFPLCRPFPIGDILSAAKTMRLRHYFTNSIATLMALALFQNEGLIAGVDRDWREMLLYGIDLRVGTEWEHQRPCVEYWSGVLDARGIAVETPPTSALMWSSGIYAYDELANLEFRTLEEVRKVAVERVLELQRKRDRSNETTYTFDGALQEARGQLEKITQRQRGGVA